MEIKFPKWSECWNPKTGALGGIMFGVLFWGSIYIIFYIGRWLIT